MLITGDQETPHAGFKIHGELYSLVGVVNHPVGVLNPLNDRQQVADHCHKQYGAEHTYTQGQSDVAAQELAKALLIYRCWCIHISVPCTVVKIESLTDSRVKILFSYEVIANSYSEKGFSCL